MCDFSIGLSGTIYLDDDYFPNEYENILKTLLQQKNNNK